MTANRVHPERVTVRDLLTKDCYRIPVYQRNYAWGEVEIRQLIDDLIDAADDPSISEYFLGNVVVSTAGSGEPFSVVDGQQRLATLHILFKYLSVDGSELTDLDIRALEFEARPRASRAFMRLGTSVSDDDLDPGILAGYRVVEQYGRSRDLATRLRFILDRVLVVRMELPEGTNLNGYFEVMNTRGEQLEQQDIVKARMMAELKSDTARSTFAWVWDACADMDSYVQMSFAADHRWRLFGSGWAWLAPESFDELEAAHAGERTTATGGGVAPRTLDDAIRAYSTIAAASEDPEDIDRFNSVVQFPVFLLHVLRVVQGGDLDESEVSLDDKKLVKRFNDYIEGGDPETTVKMFALSLLKCRVLFDAFVIKREFTTRTRDEGVWSLKRLVRDGKSARYVGTFAIERSADRDGEADDDPWATKRVRLLEAALRVTYTSPRTMHWITDLLAFAFAERPENLTFERVKRRLEAYARDKVVSAFDEHGTLPSGFGIARIMFTYLDYLLAVRNRDLDFQFMFRNSVEHFYPQSPDDELRRDYGELDDESDKELFGNLALVTVRGNSKFTNLPPHVKAGYDRIVAQSPKLREMARIAETNRRAWDSDAIRSHHDAMLSILRRDVSLRELGLGAET